MRDPSAPVRVTWDLPPDPGLAARVWARLARGRVLFVEARVRPDAQGGLPGLAAGVSDHPGPRLSVLGRPDPLLAALDALGPRGVADADWVVLPPFGAGLQLERLAGATQRITPAVWCDPAGLAALVDALAVARRYRLAAVAVLHPPAPAEPLSPADRDRAAAVWREAAEVGMDARIHDLFLADALGLDPFGRYAACQAGAAMAHVTAEGRLVACRTLPVDLGDLASRPLDALWAGPERTALRERLAAVPGACTGCALAGACAGGCRGLSPDLARDPSCPGPREARP